MNKVLEVKDLSFSYEEEVVLKSISFEVYENEFAAIIGDNGAGKSTLMNLIIGNLRASSATVAVAVAKQAMKDGIATKQMDNWVQAVQDAMWQPRYS